MKTRQFRILKAIHLLSEIGHGSRITIGEISRWTKIPQSSCKRALEKLEKMKLVEHETFTRGAVSKCKDYYTTELGTEFFEAQKELF